MNQQTHANKNRQVRLPGRVGVFSVVHGIYFTQFEGLKESLTNFHQILCDDIRKMDVELTDYGIIENDREGYALIEKIRRDGVDLLFCNMITYATSSVFAPIVKALDTPIVLLALQPRQAMDYTKASTFMQLKNDNICSVPEYTYTARRLGHPVKDVVIGCLFDDPKAMQSIREWCQVAAVLRAFQGARIGLMGHVLEAMYDMHADPTAVSAAFGVHVPLLEIDELIALEREVTEEETKEKIAVILDMFDTPDPKSDAVTRKLTDEDLHQAARSAVALDKLIEKEHLTGLAYYYEGLPDSLQRKIAGSLIVGNSLLNASGFPMCGEYDIKTCIGMLIMDRLGIGGSFAELHPFDFEDDCILVGHDGPHHIAIAEGRPVLRSLIKYHGKPGSGASVEFKIKEGDITMLGVTTDEKGGFRFLIGEGISKKGPIPPTGNTNTRGFFAPNTKDFIRAWVLEGPTHHFALGVGHHAKQICRVADCLGIPATVVKA